MKGSVTKGRRLSPSALAVSAIAVALLAVVATKKCGDSEHPALPDAAAIAAPVPVPQDLIGELYLRTPNAAWNKLQRGVGGALGILPATFAGVVLAFVGLDPFTAEEVDTSSPAHGVLAGDLADPHWALAMRLAEPRHARIALVEAETARFTARRGAENVGLTELVAKGQGVSAAMALTDDGWLVLARKSEDLPSLGAYVSRALPARPQPEGSAVIDVPREALAKVIRPKLEQWWEQARAGLLDSDERMRRERGGRAPDFGDPKAIVAALDQMARRPIAILGELDGVRMTAELGDEDARLTATLAAAADSGPAAEWIGAMENGDPGKLLGLPSQSTVALWLHEGERDREREAKFLEDGVLSALGDRLVEGDRKRIRDVAADLVRARGETLALSWDADSLPGLGIRTRVRDAAAANRGLRTALELVRVPPFKDLLHVRETSTTTAEVDGLGKASVTTMTRDAHVQAAKAPPGKAPAIGVAWWWPTESELALAVSPEPTAVLRAVGKPEKVLADEPAVRSALAPMGDAATTVLALQPLRLDPKRAMLPVAPLVLAVGRRERKAVVHLTIANALLREAARRQIGF